MTIYPIELLNLSTRLENSLKKAKINTLNDLSGKNEIAISKIRNIGFAQINYLNSHLFLYLCNTRYLDCTNDALKEFDHTLSCLQQFIATKADNNKPHELAANLDSINAYLHNLWNEIVDLQLSEKEICILHYRLRFVADKKSDFPYTLEEIGQLSQLNLTRERIRQIEKKLLNKIKRRILLCQLESSCFSDLLQQFSRIIKQKGVLEWPISLPEIIKDLMLPLADFSPSFYKFIIEEYVIPLEFTILDIGKTKYLLATRFSDHDKLLSHLKKCLELIDNNSALFLQTSYISNILVEQFSDRLSDIQKEILLRIISIMSDYSMYPDLTFHRKKTSRIGFVYEVLNNEGKPLHYEEITRRINVLTHRNYSSRSMMSVLLSSPLTHSLGDGRYALKEWGYKVYHRTRFDNDLSINSLIKSFMMQNSPCTYNAIESYILSRREASPYTIKCALNLLGYHADFDHKYSLSKTRRRSRLILSLSSS